MSNVTYEQMMKNYVNADYQTLLSVAMQSLNKFMPVFDNISEDGNGASYVFPFICVTLAVDGQFSELEYRFACDITGLEVSYDQFKGMVQQYYTEEWIVAVDNLIDKCSQDLKQEILAFCLAFAAVDEKISREENTFFAMLLDD